VRVLKWISWGLGGLIVLVVLGVLVVIWFVDPNRFKSNIEAAVRDATGRELTLIGDIELGFFPWLALRSGEGRFANPPGFGTEPMVSWKSAQLGARLFPLLRGELVADRVVLRGADVRLVRRADGTANWEGMGTGQAIPQDDQAPKDIRIDGVRIEDSRLSFVDEAARRTIQVSSLALTTDEISPGEPLTDTGISGVLHVTGFPPAGVPFRMEVPELIAPKDFSALQVDEFELSFGGLEVEGALKGTLGDHPRLEGELRTNVFDPRALLGAVGVAAPKTTDPRALGKLQLAGRLKMDGGAIAFEPFTLLLDDTNFAGHFRLAASEGASGEFALRGDRLDVARYIPPPDPASEPFVLPTAMIKALEFRGNVELEQVTLGDVDMKGVAIRLLLDEHGLRTAPTPERPQ
jgi:AsmA protein